MRLAPPTGPLARAIFTAALTLAALPPAVAQTPGSDHEGPVVITLTGVPTGPQSARFTYTVEARTTAQNVRVEVIGDAALPLRSVPQLALDRIASGAEVTRSFEVVAPSDGVWRVAVLGSAEVAGFQDVRPGAARYLRVEGGRAEILTPTEYVLLQHEAIRSRLPADDEVVPAPPLPDPVPSRSPPEAPTPGVQMRAAEEPAPAVVYPQAESSVTSAGTVTVYGYVSYNDNGVQRYLRNVAVYLYDDDTVACGGDDLLASTVTNGNGYYSFTVQNDDCSGTLDIYVRVTLATTQFLVKDPASGAPYTQRTNTEGDVADGSYNRSVTVQYDRASELYDTMEVAWQTVTATGRQPGEIHLEYPADRGPSAATSIAPPVIFIPGPDPDDYTEAHDVIRHEYGHGMMSNAYSQNMPDGAGGPHAINECYNDGLAWSEGWATFFSQVIENDGVYDSATFSAGVEYVPSWYCTGQTNEQRVAGALYDLWDSNNDNLDQNSGHTVSFQTMWRDAMWGKRRNSFTSYWNTLRTYLGCEQIRLGADAIANNTITVDGTALRVSLSGPGAAGPSDPVTVNASVTCGSGSITYQWSENGVSTRSLTTTQSSDALSTFMPLNEDLMASLTVTSAGESASGSHFVLNQGGSCDSGEVICEALVANAVPEVFAVRPPHPNPARGEVTVEYDLPDAADVAVVVYDVAGREVARLVDGYVGAGYHEARLDGSALPSGVYVVRVTAGAEAATQRLTVVR